MNAGRRAAADPSIDVAAEHLSSDPGCAPSDSPSGSPSELTSKTSYTGGSWLQRRIGSAIVFYQRAREGRPSPCRFFPTCSSYALEAVEVHGSWRGGWLSVRRLLRCRPLGPSGFDPVPAPRSTPSVAAHTRSSAAVTAPLPNSPLQKSLQKGR